MPSANRPFDHLDALEAEAITIFRECLRPDAKTVILYSIGKDSSVLLHLARKAFYPAPIPFPVLHVDTGWKFREMYALRDRTVAALGLDLIVHINPDGQREGVGPFTHGSAHHTDVMKTVALKQALDEHGFDLVIGGARRDEERSRAKERVFSVRQSGHRWDPKAQRPELWDLYNLHLAPGQSMRVFPLSNWTESDIWRYIQREGIDIVPLYLAKARPVVARGGQWIMADDDRLPLAPGEVPVLKTVRFRTLGCWPLTAAVESTADTLEAVVAETLSARTSERQGRLIDQDGAASMERKKQEGYF
ncbi:MAG: sulfate adenylyltransferase subunit CysD [Candidatus Sericytochromatia bacterium]